MRASLDDSLRPDDVYATMHWTDQFTSSGPIDRLVHAAPDPISGQPDLKGTPARISATPELWRGQMFRLTPGRPDFGDTVWWSKAQLDEGTVFELAGWSALGALIHSEDDLRQLLGIASGTELVSFSSPRNATFRFAAFAGNRLMAFAFFGPGRTLLVETETARVLLGKEVTTVQRLSLLSGIACEGVGPASRTVCSCYSVTEAQIRQTIAAKGLVTAAQIGHHLKAGTNCGSCVPELKNLLAEMSPAEVS